MPLDVNKALIDADMSDYIYYLYIKHRP